MPLKKAKQWLRTLNTKKFLDEDVRIVVPVLSSASGTETRNWAILGIGLKKVHSYYARKPEIRSVSESKEDCSYRDKEMRWPNSWSQDDFDWQSRDFIIPVHIFQEITLGPEPLTRDEFRGICDAYKTKDEIIEALVGPSPKRNTWVILFGFAAAVFIATCFVTWRYTKKPKSNQRPV